MRVESPVNLSAEQRLSWFLHQLAPDSPANHAFASVRLHFAVNHDRLRRVFQLLADRHASLRTLFAVSGGQPVQLVEQRREVDFIESAAAGLSEEALAGLLTDEAARPFDLEQGPLLRVRLWRRSAGECVLSLAGHRIVCDDGSLSTLLDEAAALYGGEAELNGDAGARLPPAASYTNHVEWQEALLSSPEGARLRGYWERRLAGALPVLKLSIERARPSTLTYRSDSASLCVGGEATAGLESYAASHGADLPATLLALWYVLLYRYSGQEDVLVGLPTTSRGRLDVASAVGNFDNYLVLRAGLGADTTFVSLLGQVSHTLAEAFEHRDYPFLSLLESLQPSRDVSRWPLFQVTFSFRHRDPAEGEAPPRSRVPADGWRAEPFAPEAGDLARRGSPFDLTLEVVQGGDGLGISLTYNRDVFEAEVASRMLRHYRTLLESVASQPSERRVSAMPLLAAEEREQLLAANDAGGGDGAAGHCLHHFFEAQAERAPEAAAVVFEGQQLSYGELNRRANRVAHHLRTLGVGPEVCVAVFMEPSLEMVAGCMGILKAGGAVLYTPTTLPAERIALMLEETAAHALLTSEGLVSKLPPHDLKLVRLDADAELLARQPETNPEVAVAQENLAFLAYTSGTTGRPKATLLEHRALSHASYHAVRDYGLAPPARVLDLQGMSTFMLALPAGATAVLAGPTTFLSASGLINLLREQKVTYGVIPPALLVALPGEGLPDLETLLTGGDRVPAESVARWAASRRLFKSYSCTEAQCGTRVQYTSEFQDQETIGHPIGGAQFYILDEHLEPTPPGVTGEVYIGGAGLARGYLRHPALTAEKFLPHPFGKEPGSRLYRTGDLARLRADGQIEFSGRLDHQVKIRGHRVELEEVEAELRKHPKVRQAVVVALPDAGGESRLVGYAAAGPGQELTHGELRSHLRRSLPDYMVPSAFVTLERLPLLPGGKIDRRSLPAPHPVAQGPGESYAPPRSELERVITSVWQEVLNVERVGLYEDFFDLGGHSLLILKMQERLRQELGREIPVAELFQCPTVAALVTYLNSDAAEPFVLRRREESLNVGKKRLKQMFGKKANTHDRGKG
jgi:amino acid adenylation domain-containing protein